MEKTLQLPAKLQYLLHHPNEMEKEKEESRRNAPLSSRRNMIIKGRVVNQVDSEAFDAACRSMTAS